jgi:3-oxoacyl-[acyl-carrier-protein] synthase III
MRIAGNSVVFPQLIVTNDDICRHIFESTKGVRGSARNLAVNEAEKFLVRMGAKYRRWLSASERPFHLISQAYEIALERAQGEPGVISNLIYCGVDRVLLEPANSALLAAQLKLTRARAFDISHACQGWFTALQIAGDRADHHGETSLILSAEFPMTSGGVARPKNFDLSDFKPNHWKLATFLLGEAATATIVVPGGKPLCYRQQNDNQGYRASYVRLPQAERFAADGVPMFEAPELTFYASASELLEFGVEIGFEVIEQFGAERLENSTIIPHTISTRLLEFLNRKYRRKLDVLNLFPEFGNIGSTSLPAGLQQYQMGRSQNQDGSPQPIGWMIAAGMSASAFEFPLSSESD